MSCCNNKYPSLYKMAENATLTVIQAIRHAVKTGEMIALDDVIKKRMDICSKCDRKSGVRCRECGCYINLKTAVQVAKCPIGKW